jgi:hypothetical protein
MNKKTIVILVIVSVAIFLLLPASYEQIYKCDSDICLALYSSRVTGSTYTLLAGLFTGSYGFNDNTIWNLLLNAIVESAVLVSGIYGFKALRSSNKKRRK